MSRNQGQIITQLNKKLTAKEDEVSELRQQFDELMKNPITFKQRHFLETQLLPITRKYGIPDKLAAAQWAIETGRNTNRADNNYFGIGPGWKFTSIEENVKVYARSLKTIIARKGLDFDEIKHDPYLVLVKLQEGNYRYEGHSDKPLEYIELVSGMNEWRIY